VSRQCGGGVVCSKLGRIPTVAEYMEAVGVLNKDSANIYKSMNFDQIEEYAETAMTA
jgi:aconitate hydratase 2 / 2-methylisocitrate dehydratase